MNEAIVRLDYVCRPYRYEGHGHMTTREDDPATAPYVIDCTCGRPAEVVQRAELDAARAPTPDSETEPDASQAVLPLESHSP